MTTEGNFLGKLLKSACPQSRQQIEFLCLCESDVFPETIPDVAIAH
jgi:hypothetical protein